ncbi:MAG: glutamate racemase [Lachnospiraceae bacterium]|nr:glutamate racemase [Lachnospiraceae bacterium]
MEQAIGVFDSGVGGLTVAREIMRQLPYESLIYFGDTARVPYGNKSAETVIRFSKQIVRFLMTKNVKAIVVACNTASALALSSLQEEFDVPIIGVIEPGAVAAVKSTVSKNIGVIATEATVKSGSYNKCLRILDPKITVVSKACPLFVPLVEEGLLEDRITDDVIQRYLHELKDYQVDALILGCTHYPLLRNAIGRYMGEEVKLVNPAYETAKALKALLYERSMLNEDTSVSPHHAYFVSDGVDNFIKFADNVLPADVKMTSLVNIESY